LTGLASRALIASYLELNIFRQMTSEQTKELYVVGYCHPESNSDLDMEGIRPGVLHNVNLAYKICAEINRVSRVTSLYMDGFDETGAAVAIDYLRQAVEACEGENPSDVLKMGLREANMRNDIDVFNTIFSTLLMNALSPGGSGLTLEPTDYDFDHFRKVVSFQLLRYWCIANSKNRESLSSDDRAEYIKFELKFRDDKMYKSILDTASGVNMLLVGLAHPLDNLMADPRFSSFRVDINNLDHDGRILVSGKLPQKLSTISECIDGTRKESGLEPFLFLPHDVGIDTQIEFV